MKHELLFVYGTLLNQRAQTEVIGRVVPGKPDTLHDYMVVLCDTSEGKYPVAIENSESYIPGQVIEVTLEELDQIDSYETGDYRRERLPLQSGLEAWVYLKG